MAVCKAGYIFLNINLTNPNLFFFRASHSNLPLYQYIAKLSNSSIRLPVPAFNVIFNFKIPVLNFIFKYARLSMVAAMLVINLLCKNL